MSDINVTINDIANCTIPVVDKAKYLGSILDREPGHEADVDARIASASSAFAKLKPLVFKNKNISIEAKRAAYVACVLTILLYGSECWALTARMRAKLATFHNMAARCHAGDDLWLSVAARKRAAYHDGDGAERDGPTPYRYVPGEAENQVGRARG